jgi:hypothetical protein
MSDFELKKAKDLAKLLIEKWSTDGDTKEVWKERGAGVSTDDVVTLLKFLWDLKKLTTLEGAAERVPEVIGHIKTLQNSFGLKPSFQDGIFGRITRNFLEKRRACPPPPDPTDRLSEHAANKVKKVQQSANLTVPPILY